MTPGYQIVYYNKNGSVYEVITEDIIYLDIEEATQSLNDDNYRFQERVISEDAFGEEVHHYYFEKVDQNPFGPPQAYINRVSIIKPKDE